MISPKKTGKVYDAEAAPLREAWQKTFPNGHGKRKEIAAKYGISVSFLNRMMGGYDKISVLWKCRFSEFLGMDASEIWVGFDLVKELGDQLPPLLAELLKAGAQSERSKIEAAILLLQLPSPPG